MYFNKNTSRQLFFQTFDCNINHHFFVVYRALHSYRFGINQIIAKDFLNLAIALNKKMIIRFMSLTLDSFLSSLISFALLQAFKNVQKIGFTR
jgi:hypothetical protein